MLWEGVLQRFFTTTAFVAFPSHRRSLGNTLKPLVLSRGKLSPCHHWMQTLKTSQSKSRKLLPSLCFPPQEVVQSDSLNGMPFTRPIRMCLETQCVIGGRPR